MTVAKIDEKEPLKKSRKNTKEVEREEKRIEKRQGRDGGSVVIFCQRKLHPAS